jgi:hypothetical protein
MGLKERDYMQDQGGEERGRRYDREADEARYGGFRSQRQAQLRKLVIIVPIVIAVLVALALLIPTNK